MKIIMNKLFGWDENEWKSKKLTMLVICVFIAVIIFGIVPWIYGLFYLYIFKIFV